MRNLTLVPSGPGAYSEWPTLVGAPTPWQAANAVDSAYIQSAVAGQRQSFPLALPVPAIGSDETLLSAIYRGYLATPPASAVLQDGGFEQTSTFWTLSTECATQGAAFVGSPVRSGTKALRIQSRTVGPTCGQADQTVPGFIVGRTYQISGFYQSTSITTQKFQILVQGNSIGSFGSSSASWVAFSGTFVASQSTHVITIYFKNADATLRTYFFDDLSLVGVGEALVTPFYRLFGVDTDLDPWSVPDGQTVSSLKPDRPITLYGWQLRDGGFELGIRNQNGFPIRADLLSLDVSLRRFTERLAFVGREG